MTPTADITSFDSFRAVVALWGSPAALATDIGAPVTAARKWDQRDRIPDEWWSAILSTDRAKSAGLTADDLVALAARPAGERR